MEINSEDPSNLFFSHIVADLEPSPHTVRQRRWRQHRKHTLNSTHLRLPLPTVEQVIEKDLYLSSRHENFEDNSIIENNNYENTLITNDDNYEDNLIDDDNYNLNVNLDDDDDDEL
ncbi:unnamed protein product [Rotaria sp. Silwood1]|nr:unnamed protein product [Rotaria sp. Silwood1]CAF5070605.1 unnamed protein product [Rotaria sp. Silwood1]